jgi:hypothetical protein
VSITGLLPLNEKMCSYVTVRWQQPCSEGTKAPVLNQIMAGGEKILPVLYDQMI